jgi:hypothetical protein
MSRNKIEADLNKIHRTIPCTTSDPEGSCESVWYFFLSSGVHKVAFTLENGNTIDFYDNKDNVTDHAQFL